jgi:hypothetical protein
MLGRAIAHRQRVPVLGEQATAQETNVHISGSTLDLSPKLLNVVDLQGGLDYLWSLRMSPWRTMTKKPQPEGRARLTSADSTRGQETDHILAFLCSCRPL